MRTYLRDLYVKIPVNYLFSNDRVYFEHSDKFSKYSLIELAGKDRLMFLDDFLVFKRLQISDKKCEKALIHYEEYKARIYPPFIALKDLNE